MFTMLCYAILLCCILYLLYLISLVYASNVSMCHILLKKVCFYLISTILNLTLSPSFRLTASTVKWVAMWYVWCYLKSHIFWFNLTMRLLISYLDRNFLKLTPVSSFLSNCLTTLTVTECTYYECFGTLTFWTSISIQNVFLHLTFQGAIQ